MCNLYSVTTNQEAIRNLFRVGRDLTGNLPWLPGVFPDYSAPIVRNGQDGERELVMARWGMPSPVFALQGRKTDPGVTNIRNVKSPHWRRWLGEGCRCLVPMTSFSEYNKAEGGDIWFALSEERPMTAFAGVWTNWTSVRKLKEGEVTCDLYGFLTTDPNAEVGAIQPEGDARDPDHGRGMGRMAPGAMGRGVRPAATAAGRLAPDRGARGKEGRAASCRGVKLALIRLVLAYGHAKNAWITDLLGRLPFNVATVALANKTARIAWAIMASGEEYWVPV